MGLGKTFKKAVKKAVKRVRKAAKKSPAFRAGKAVGKTVRKRFNPRAKLFGLRGRKRAASRQQIIKGLKRMPRRRRM